MDEVLDIMAAHRQPDVAEGMAAYLRNQFSFLGLKKPLRSELAKPFLKQAKQAKMVDWAFVEKAWTLDEREYQYVAVDVLRTQKHLLMSDDLQRIKSLIVRRSWWDTVDSMAPLISHLGLEYPKIRAEMINWSLSDNIWVRRMAIIHQLNRKEKTDVALLHDVIVNNFNSMEFFINKGIGWALREYAKTDADLVRQFISEHQDGLSKLSIREGSKYL